jgi:type I restriction enzyme, S subunit
MAIWSLCKQSEVLSSGRMDAEYFRPIFIELEKTLASLEAKQLRNYLDFVRCGPFGSTITCDTYSKEGVVVARPFNIEGMEFRYKNLAFIDIKDVKRKGLFLYSDGDIFFSRVGDIRVGYLAHNDKFPNLTISPNIIACRIKPYSIKSGYLTVFLNTKYGKLQIERGLKVVAQPTISTSLVSKIRLFVPNKADEENINSLFIQSLDSYKKSNGYYTQAQQLLESELGLDKLDLKKSLSYTVNVSELVTSQRLDSEFFDPVATAIVEKIKSLDHVKLIENCIVGNGFPWNSEKFLPDNSGEPVVRIRNIKPSYVDIEELTSIEPNYARKVGFTKAKRGDVLIGMDGLKYFYASLLEGPCYVNQRVAHLTWLPNAKISPEYTTFIINSKVGQAQLLSNMTIATTVGHITNRDISKLLIPYISDSFHQKITELVRQSIDKKQESKRLLEQAKTRVEQLIEEAVQA